MEINKKKVVNRNYNRIIIFHYLYFENPPKTRHLKVVLEVLF